MGWGRGAGGRGGERGAGSGERGGGYTHQFVTLYHIMTQ